MLLWHALRPATPTARPPRRGERASATRRPATRRTPAADKREAGSLDFGHTTRDRCYYDYRHRGQQQQQCWAHRRGHRYYRRALPPCGTLATVPSCCLLLTPIICCCATHKRHLLNVAPPQRRSLACGHIKNARASSARQRRQGGSSRLQAQPQPERGSTCMAGEPTRGGGGWSTAFRPALSISSQTKTFLANAFALVRPTTVADIHSLAP